jgi:hypothetical protein
MADTIATGYQDVASIVLEGRPLKVVFLWKEADLEWWGCVGELNPGGTAYTYSTPEFVIANAERGGAFTLREDGIPEFEYRVTGDTEYTVRGRAIKAGDLGPWS